jgi:hypothetical protein
MPGTTSTMSGDASICSCLGGRACVSIDSGVVTRRTYLGVTQRSITANWGTNDDMHEDGAVVFVVALRTQLGRRPGRGS